MSAIARRYFELADAETRPAPSGPPPPRLAPLVMAAVVAGLLVALVVA